MADAVSTAEGIQFCQEYDKIVKTIIGGTDKFMNDTKLPVLLREFVPASNGNPLFSKDQTLVILQILTDSFKGFSKPAVIVGERKNYNFGDAVGILVDTEAATKLEQSWKKEGKPLAYYSNDFHSFRLA